MWRVTAMRVMLCTNFFSLLVAYIENGKHGSLPVLLSQKRPMSHLPPLCCLPRVQPGPYFYIVIRQCILQYVIVKPVMSVCIVVLNILQLYQEGSLSPTAGYLYITIIVNSSVLLSVYCLIFFYFVTEEELTPYKPIPKYLCVKAILYFSFWQSTVIGILSNMDVIPRADQWSKHDVGKALNDYLICVEMLVLSAVHIYVYPYSEYVNVRNSNVDDMDGRVTSPKAGFQLIQPVRNLGHVMDQSDLISDIVVAYHPSQIASAKEEQQKLNNKSESEAENTVELEEQST